MGDNETWGEDPHPSDYPATSALLENVSLTGEEEVGTLLPESVHDNDHLANLRHRQSVDATRIADVERGKEYRAKKRLDRYNAVLERVVQFIESRHLMPASWLERSTESGERYPHFVCVIKNGFSRWWRSAGAAISTIASILWILQWALGAPSVVMHDGTQVVNLWQPSTIYTVDLTSTKVSTWLSEHRSNMRAFKTSDFRSAYFDAEVYHANERRNITFEWLYHATHEGCRHDEGADVRCDCIPAVEIGLMANVIITGDGIPMFNPHITRRSDIMIPVLYDGVAQASQPSAIKVEYMNSDGQIERVEERLERAACITRSIDLVQGV